MPRQITKAISINKSAETVFEALITPSWIRQWWSANTAIVLPKTGGIYAVTRGEEDRPDYISCANIRKIEAPSRLQLADFRYASKEGELPFDADLAVAFSIELMDEGTQLQVTQTGFPDEAVADEFYNGCIRGWEDTLVAFKKTVEAAKD